MDEITSNDYLGSMPKSRQPLSNFGQGVKKFTAENSAAKFYPNQIAYLRGKRYETEKKIQGGTGANQYSKEQSRQSDDSADLSKTTERIAKEYGVGTATIERNARFTKVVDILPEPVKQGILSGEQKISHADTSTIIKMDKPTQKKFIKEVESGTPIKEAVKRL